MMHRGMAVVFGMKTLKIALATGAFVSVAIITVSFVGSGSADTGSTTQTYQTQVTSRMVVNNAKSDSIFGVPDVVTTPLPHVRNVETVASVNVAYPGQSAPTLGTIQMTPSANCQTVLTASTGVAALVDLELSANCHPNTPFVMRHMGLAFSGKTDPEGKAQIRAPALSKDARFAVFFRNLEAASVTQDVPDAELYDRAILQWRGTDNLQLHALEFGARIGDQGHIWTASTRSPEMAASESRGFMMRLGRTDVDLPYMAEIYTFPSGLSDRSGAISLHVGAFVTQRNCGRKVDAEAIQTNSGNLVVARGLRIPMPTCDALGRSVMMPNMFQDVTLAAR